MKPRVLVVDDEQQVIDALGLSLRKHFEIMGATSGADALEILGCESIPVVISDMRMPTMDGVTFLSKARDVSPETVRMMFTGHADLGAAMSAVNEGHIFRFMTKPTPPPAMLAAVNAAVEQHRLITSERELLERTLVGSVQTMCEALSLNNPIAFGRTNRIKLTARALTAELDLDKGWQVELAAMVSQLGMIALPHELVARLDRGDALTEPEKKVVTEAQRLNERMISNIPRLEAVLEIVSGATKPLAARKSIGASILRAAIDKDLLESRGRKPEEVDADLKATGEHDPRVLVALERIVARARKALVQQLPLSAVKPGMVLADDVRSKAGRLVVSRGFEMTEASIERLRNFDVVEPLAVVVYEVVNVCAA